MEANSKKVKFLLLIRAIAKSDWQYVAKHAKNAGFCTKHNETAFTMAYLKCNRYTLNLLYEREKYVLQARVHLLVKTQTTDWEYFLLKEHPLLGVPVLFKSFCYDTQVNQQLVILAQKHGLENISSHFERKISFIQTVFGVVSKNANIVGQDVFGRDIWWFKKYGKVLQGHQQEFHFNE